MSVYTAQQVTATRLCAVGNCPYDAETNGICRYCQARQRRGATLELHTTNQPAQDSALTTLRCSICQRYKPDDDFAHQRDKVTRRGRHSSCRTCDAKRRSQSRRVHCKALTTKPDNTGAAGRPCRAWATLGSLYCSSHKDTT